MKFASLLLIVALATPLAFARPDGERSSRERGPGAGGGTNVYPGQGPGASKDVLVDFAPTAGEIGINPKTFEGILDRLQAKLDRLNYFYPGLKGVLESVFEKRWKMTREQFAPENPGELKPIEQTEYFVKINYDWFKTATDVQKEQAWMHEMVRNYVEGETRRAWMLRNYLKTDKDFLHSIDQIVYAITPLFYNEDSFDRISWEWTHAFRENYFRPYILGVIGDGHEDVYPGNRSMMYLTIRMNNLKERYQVLCDDSILNNPSRLRQLIVNAPAYRDRLYDPDHLRRYPTKREEMLNSAVGISSQWQLRGGEKWHNAYSSPEITSVSTFAVRTTSVLEGKAYNTSYEFLTGTKVRSQFTIEERMQLLRTTCAVDTGLLPQIFAEYDKDGGNTQHPDKTQADATADKVHDFFNDHGD